MQKAAPSVSIVIPAWNAIAYTLDCLASLKGLNYQNYQIILVDNGSTDGTAEKVREHYPDVTVLRNETNRGFAQACNQGLAVGFGSGADFAFLLNNDTLVDPELLTQLVETAELRPHGGIFGPRICYADRPETAWFTGMRFSMPIYFVRTAARYQVQATTPTTVDFVSGCGMLIGRRVYERIGGLNEDYFMYYEDLDYCLTAKKAGFDIVYTPKAQMWHVLSVSSGGKDSALKQYHQVKSGLIFYRRHASGIWRVISILLRVTHAVWTALKLFLRGRLQVDVVRHYFRGLRESAAIEAPEAGAHSVGGSTCCPLCDGASSVLVHRGTDLLHGGKGEFAVYECRNCRVRYQWPQPGSLESLYPEDYGGYRPDAPHTRSRFRSQSLQRRVALINQLSPRGGRLLDVGCGSGDFLDAARSTGLWQVEGLEPNAAAAEAAAKTLGARVYPSELLSVDPSGPFQVITMWHVLEHVPDPRRVLQAALARLADDGHLVVACPMLDSPEASVFGRAWAGYDLPRHLYMFSRMGLGNLFKRSGGEAREVRGVIAGFNSCKISLVMWLKLHRAPGILLYGASVLAAGLYLLLFPFSLKRPSVGVFVVKHQAESASSPDPSRFSPEP